MEQTVLLLGQASNSISYHRMFDMLLALTNSPQQSKKILQENGNNLFRKKFKSKKQTLEMLPKTSRTKYKPFRHSLPQTPKRSFGGQQQQKLLLRKGTTYSIQKNYAIIAIKTAMDTDMVNINQEALFSKVEFPYVVPVEDLKQIHPCVKSLYCTRKIPNVQLAGRLKNFIESPKILTNDTEILWLVGCYAISFHKIPQ